MKKTVRILLMVLCMVCLSALFAAVDVAAATDYGLEIFGKAVTSDYKSNASEGWSFDPAANTLTLTDGDKFTAAFEKMTQAKDMKIATFSRYDPSIGSAAFAFYMAAVEVKTLTNLTVKVTGDVTVGRSNWSDWSNVGMTSERSPIRSLGFYSKSGGITVTGDGKLTVYSSDSAFYTNGDFKTDGKVRLDLETYRTAAIYAQGKIIIDNGSTVNAKTNYLCGIYKSYYSILYYDGSKGEKDSEGTIQYDSMAAVISTKGTHPNGISVLNGSTLNVDAHLGDVEETKIKLTQNREQMPDASNMSDGTRAYYAIWADRADINIEGKSKLKVDIDAAGDLYRRLHPAVIGWKCLYRTIVVNASNVTVKNSDLVIEADNRDVSFKKNGITYTGKELGDYAEFFYDQSFYYPETSLKDNSIRASMFYMRGASSVQLSMDGTYGESNLCRLLDYKSDRFEFSSTYEGKSYYYCEYPRGDYNGGVYLYLKSYEKGSTYYLRKNGDKYEYSEYFDFRSGIKYINSNVLDIAALGWSNKTIYIRSGNYTIKLPVNNNAKIIHDNWESTVTIKLEGGKTYNGIYHVTIAGKLIVEGDGIIKELHTHGTSTLMWDGHPGLYELAVPHIFVNSGTIAGGSSNGVRINVLGGNVAYNEDMQADYYGPNGSRTLKRITIDLGEFADIFTSDMLRISSEFSHNTTGLYPVDGKIYFWELEDKYWNVGDHPSQLEFNHLEITEDYTYYVYPKKVTDSQGNVINRQYKLYRLPERLEIYPVNKTEYFESGTNDYASGVVLKSFYYSLVVDRPKYSDPLYTDETTTVELCRYDIPQNGDYVEWTCKDKDGNKLTLGRSYDSLSMTTGDLHYRNYDYKCTLYAIDGKVKKSYDFDVYILLFYNTGDQYAGKGETVTFEAQYYKDGTWLEELGFEWAWQWRAGSKATWNTVNDTDAFFEYAAFDESWENNSHCYQFRRVAYLSRINKESILIGSPIMLLNMSTHVTNAPKTVNIQSNDPAEAIQITVDAERVSYNEWWYKKEGWDKSVLISGAKSLTLSLPRSEYTDENGNWDPSKVDGTYYCSMNDIRFGTTTSVEIEVKVVDHVSFTSDPVDKFTAIGGIAEFYVGISKDPPFCGSLWWEYSLDDGTTWEQVSERTSTEAFQVAPSIYFIPIETESGIRFHSHYDACRLTVNAAGMDADKILVRCAMDDGKVKYYTKTATLTFVDMPVIGKQPQSQVLSITQGTGSMDFSFAEPLPDIYTVTYQWQIYEEYPENAFASHWEDIVNNDIYTCNDQRIEFNLEKHNFTGKYRCKISFTDSEGVTVDVYTDAATLDVVTVPKFKGDPTLNRPTVWVGDRLNVDIYRDDCTFTGYKWQVCKDGVNWEDTDDSFTAKIYNYRIWLEFTVTEEMENWKFRCVLINEFGGVTNTATSNELVLYVLSNECSNEYELRQAVANAKSKGYDTIKLLDDITLTSTLVLESAKLTDITIDLNGHILQSDGGKFTMLEVQDGVTLTIIDSNSTKDNGPDIPFTGGSIRGAVGEIGGAVRLKSGATFNFNAGTIYNCTATRGAAVYMELGESSFFMNGGSIYDCTASAGAAVFMGPGKHSFVMNTGSITGCTANYGTAVYMEYGTHSFVMNGGSISGCTADFGAAVYMGPDEHSFEMNGGEISNCTATKYGAAVFMGQGKHNFVMNDGKIVGCNQAICVNDNTRVELVGGTIEYCPSVIYFVDATNKSAVRIMGTTIRNCVYEKTGEIDYFAPIYVDGFFAMGDGEISSCGNKSGNGGVIYLVDGYCGIIGGTIKDCYSATGNGGAIYAEAGQVRLIGTIQNCHAQSGDGGAIYAKSGRVYLLSGSMIEDCTAAGKGSAIYSYAPIWADGGVISGTVVAKGGIEKLQIDDTKTTFFGDVTCDGEDATGDIKTGMYYGKVTGISEDEDVVAVYFYSDGEVYATFVIKKGEAVKAPITPEDARTFIGWYNGDFMYDFDTPVNEDLILTAKWAISTDPGSQLEKDLDELKKALEKAIADGDKSLDDKIKALNDALNAAKVALQAEDIANKTALEGKISAAQSALQAAIDRVQQNLDNAKAELDKAITDGDKALDDKIKALNDALDAAKAALQAEDTANKTALEGQISAAQTTLQAAIDQVQKNLDDAKADLDKAITDGDKALDDKIKALNDALDAAKAALQAEDTANKTALEGQISAAQTTLQAAIDQVQKNLDNAKAELDKAIADGDKALDDKIKALSDALNAAKTSLEAANESTKAALESQIAEAKASIQIVIEQIRKDLNDAKAELDKAIADGDKALDDKIKALNDALNAAKTALEAADEANKTELEGQISVAQTTLQAAIDALNNRLATAEDELTATKKALITAIIVICSVFAVADIAILTVVLVRTRKK